jgi:hypothetical protein
MVYVYKLSKYQNIKTLEQGPAYSSDCGLLFLLINEGVLFLKHDLFQTSKF